MPIFHHENESKPPANIKGRLQGANTVECNLECHGIRSELDMTVVLCGPGSASKPRLRLGLGGLRLS
jgi:hypothetical protein